MTAERDIYSLVNDHVDSGETPLVSVVCPSFNTGPYLRAALQSILDQDYPFIEVLVMDAGSTDDTDEIVRSFGPRFGERLRYIVDSDEGQGDAINRGMSLASGDILAWLNADDEYSANAVSTAVEFFSKNSDTGLVYGAAIGTDGRGRHYGRRQNTEPGGFDDLVHDRCFIVQPASFWRKEVWEVCGPLRADMHFALDYEFFMAVAEKYEILFIDEVLAYERLHSAAKTYNGQYSRILEIVAAAELHGGNDLPRAFHGEGAAVCLIEAKRLRAAGDYAAADRANELARKWRATNPARTLAFLALLSADSRIMPRARLVYDGVADGITSAPERVQRSLPVLRQRVLRTASEKLPMLRPRIGDLSQYPARPLVEPPPFTSTLAEPPRISVVTPSFNQAKFLPATVASVLDQGYRNLEYVVQDGGSTDGSVEYLGSLESEQLRWVSEPDGGQAHAINLGFAGTTGEIMGWINSDDVLLPGALDCVAQYFNDHPDVDVVYGHRILIDDAGLETGRWIVPPHDNKSITWADYVPQETMFWRRSVWEKVGGLDESFRFALDWDLLLRFVAAGAKIERIPRFLGCFRVYSEQLTSSVIDTLGSEEMDRLRQRSHGRSVSSSEIAGALLPYYARHLVLHAGWRLGILQY